MKDPKTFKLDHNISLCAFPKEQTAEFYILTSDLDTSEETMHYIALELVELRKLAKLIEKAADYLEANSF